MSHFIVRICTVALCIAATSVAADEGWRPLAGDAAMAVLSNHRLSYANGATQSFAPSGDTSYDAGHLQAGHWRIGDEGYCSQWPPSGTWVCYRLEISADGRRLRFVAPDGSVTEGRF